MQFPMQRASQRGFTLIEMLTVVIIVGVLATLAVYGVRKYILSSKVGEAISMMSSIKSSEEGFKSETFAFLNVSGDFNDSNFYPSQQATNPTQRVGKHAWSVSGGGPIEQKWRLLGVQPDGPVLFAYAIVAGGPGDPIPALPTAKSDFGFPSTPASPFYVAVAKADLGGSIGKFTYVLSHSYSNEIYIENEGE
jgi:prepilin-type N-terminal cleavage/methylation domain-containing protein